MAWCVDGWGSVTATIIPKEIIMMGVILVDKFMKIGEVCLGKIQRIDAPPMIDIKVIKDIGIEQD